MKKMLLLYLVALCAQAKENQSNHFTNLPIDFASPTGVFELQKGWRSAIGIGAELESEYHGSSQQATELDLFIEGAYRSENWEFQSNILSNRFIYRYVDNWYMSGWINSEGGRKVADASDNSLTGLGDIEAMIEVGGGISWRPHKEVTISLIGQGYSGGEQDKGYVGFAVLHYRLLNNPKLKIDLSADMSFANSAHLTTEFGITSVQATNSAYPVYEIASGLKSYGLGLNGVYAINSNMLLSFGLDYEVLASDSAKSPLIAAGSDTEFEAGITLIYQF